MENKLPTIAEFCKNWNSQAKHLIKGVDDSLLHSLIKDYSTLLLEAFKERVKDKAEIESCNNGKGCGITYCDQLCYEINPKSIDKIHQDFLIENKLK
jgi:hypothetical protein